MHSPRRLRARSIGLALGLALASHAPTVAAAQHSEAREHPRHAKGHKHGRSTCQSNGDRRGDSHRPGNGQNNPNMRNPGPDLEPTGPIEPIPNTAINSFNAVPSVLKPGQVGKLEWSTTNTDTVAIVPAPTGVFSGNSITIQPKSTTTYALNVAGPGGAALQFITVRVDSSVNNTNNSGAQTPPAVVANPNPTPSPAPAAVSGDDKHPDGYTLVFNDEFNGNTLDRTLWCTRYAYAGGPSLQVPDRGCTGPNGNAGTLDFLNAEQQRYRDTNSQGETMHAFANGILSLRATRTGYDSYAAYEAAMIRTKFEFKPAGSTRYYISARVRLPNVKGTWPALWLAPGFGSNGQLPWPPEIDVFEGTLNGRDVKNNMIRMGSQVHGAQTSSGEQEVDYHDASFVTSSGNYAPSRSLRDVWLIIGADWTQDGICYFVDGVKTMCEAYRWVTNEGADANAAQLLLNLAVGGEWAGSGGIDDQFFPTSFDVDYVRIYRKQ